MSFDGIVVRSLSKELDSVLKGSKIDKVYQPEKDEICLKLRTNNGNKKLVLSASASNPRVYIAENYEKTNPKKAPVFCMTLRKHIQNGVIIGVEQVGFERIIRISVESYDELREKTIKDIYVEIMGKHSNIILVFRNDMRILDSVKRVPISISRERQILPGNVYELPPKQDKLNPMDGIDRDEFYERMKSFPSLIYKAIYQNILGISPTMARELCYRSGIDVKSVVGEMTREMSDSIIDNLESIFTDIENQNLYPNMVIDPKRDKIVEFSSIRLLQYRDMEEITEDSVSSAIEDYYTTKDIKDRINQRASNMRKSISIKLERVNKKIKKQEKELKESENADTYKVKGELITSYIYMITKGMDKVTLYNFYDDNKEVIVDLDVNLTPSENAQKYFRKYTKLKNANIEITKLLEENYSESRYLENTLLAIENCENEEELKEIREELIREGYLKAYRMPKKDNKPKTIINKYLSCRGNLILVGKNNKQNDYLTLKLADNEDLWFHTKDIPGSHVLLKCAGKEVDEQEIYEAAVLAAYNSKAKMSSNVPVDYTIRKNVKKPSGAKPGLVIYEKNKTIYVTPSDEEKAKIKKKGD